MHLKVKKEKQELIPAGSPIGFKKPCGTCGNSHTHTAFDGILDELGLWFNCGCGSTMFIHNHPQRTWPQPKGGLTSR